MLYEVSRNGQMYGPYTIEDLRRYVASGNIMMTDMAKGEGTDDWLPVSQILGTVEPPAAAAPPYEPVNPGYYPPQAAPYAATPAGPNTAPPNLGWGLVLLFGFLTCTGFMYIWNLILAAWITRLVPTSKVFILYIAGTVLMVLQVLAGARNNLLAASALRGHYVVLHHDRGVYGLIVIVCFVVRLIARFTMRNTLEQYYNTVEPIGLRLSGVMTFFFGGVYFQYHLNRINDIKRTMSYRAGGF